MRRSYVSWGRRRCALGPLVWLALAAYPALGRAQAPAPAALAPPVPSPTTPPAAAPGTPADVGAPAPAPAVPTDVGAPAPAPAQPAATITAPAPAPAWPLDVQLVEFQAPEGVQVEVLGPAPEAEPAPAGAAAFPRFALKVGISYWLRLTNLPNRAGVELYPQLELVGHLHQPPSVELGRFPIRVIISPDDLDDAIVRGRLVTHVVYLEDPNQALPVNMPKDQIPVLTISPAEDPYAVAKALGRPMAILKLGSRVPNPEEWSGPPTRSVPLAKCPFTTAAGGPCPVPGAPGRTTAEQPGGPWLARDEYLCDGGDHGEPAHFGSLGNLRGIDPRDAVVQFQPGDRPRVLPTNTVCLYAPRFALVRGSIGPSEAMTMVEVRQAAALARDLIEQSAQPPRRFTQNRAPEANRHRARVSSMAGRVLPFEHTEIRILQGYDDITHVGGNVAIQAPGMSARRQKAALARTNAKPVAIKTAESAIVTGIIQSASEAVMTWEPHDVVGVEEPIRRPGLAVLKRTSAEVADPGDVVTFSIQYRNMGSVPIRAVSVIDSLLPRLEYVKGSAQGPKGTVFSATENLSGSTELRWDLPGLIAPGAEGYVSFEARVR